MCRHRTELDLNDESTRFVSEVGTENDEIRTWGFFVNASVEFTLASIKSLNTKLGIEVEPLLAEINSQKAFCGINYEQERICFHH
ncbi:DUF6881 domain-containing protein [Shewanella baltica]|uniref:DUF6881 domain-containing protein n=1 Tax=Shewanella baltica TaxID=62322 RepID=UPI0035C6E07D